ncbi:glycogen synthase [Winogradskyella litorisediminis]|uniref:Glycogen synthase n=1 Tax=Winogradskyella litorisediminis TaxID=1156618 RepID=A0ABW3N7W5_9FLAO
MNILHVSAECFPVAKVGGLADVVGALPKYQNRIGAKSSVIMPMYNNAFVNENTFETLHDGQLKLGVTDFGFQIKVLKNLVLDFDTYFVHVKELLFKDYVYSADDTDRFLAFQIAALDWILQLDKKPDYIHCHDHHTGLIPFMLQESYKYELLNKIPVITTIHNAQYQGWMPYEHLHKIPEFNLSNGGLLDWNGVINPLAAAIKCAWRVTTVSPSYMEELQQNANGLEHLLLAENKKFVGILNGIDAEVWNPKTDQHLVKNFNITSIVSGKKANKDWLCKTFNLDPNKPLIAFIGRLVGEKGAELLPEVFKAVLKELDVSLFLLGSGFEETEKQLLHLREENTGNYNCHIGYDEKLSHIVYAGADFLLMPSRVEPCGLNQMYALRYATVPVVREIGGLKDTVTDINDDGFGIVHKETTVEDIFKAIKRAEQFYKDNKLFKQNRKTMMQIDHSWEASAKTYINLYQSITQTND